MIILLLLVWLIYYAVKGVIPKDKQGSKVLAIMTIISGLMCLWIISGFETGFFKFFYLVYFLYSLSEYLGEKIFDITFPVVPYFSGIYVKHKEVRVKYQVFKPFILAVANIYLLFKKLPVIGFDDEISVEVNAKDGTEVNVKI